MLEVCEKGLYTHVFPPEAAKTDLRGILALMLTSNHEQEENLPDYVCALAAQLASLLESPSCGLVDKFEWTVQAFMKKGSQMWTEADISKVLRFVVCTSKQDRERAFQIHHHFVNPQTLVIRPSFLGTAAGIGQDAKSLIPGMEFGPIMACMFAAQCLARGQSKEWDGTKFIANTIEEAEIKKLCNNKPPTLAYLRECLANLVGLRVHYNLDGLKFGTKLEKRKEWIIKANFNHRLGTSIAKGPRKDLAKRWSRAETEIREFMYEVLQKDWVPAYFAEVAKVEASMGTKSET